MALTERGRKLRAAAVSLGIRIGFGLGFGVYLAGLSVRDNVVNFRSVREQEHYLELGNYTAFAGMTLMRAALLLAGILCVAGFLRFSWALIGARGKAPLADRFEELPEKTVPPGRGWEWIILLVFALMFVAAFLLGVSWAGVSALVLSAFAILTVFVARRFQWGARQLRRKERALLACHEERIEARLKPEERIHSYSFTFLRNKPTFALVTQQRLLVFKPVLMGLDLCLDLNLPLGQMGRIRSKAPGVVRDVFVARPGLGSSGLVEIDRLGGRAVTLRLPTMADAQQMAEKLSLLIERGQAGAGALAMAEHSEGGELSHLSEQGALSRRDDL